jgi:hypothetical protein
MNGEIDGQVGTWTGGWTDSFLSVCSIVYSIHYCQQGNHIGTINNKQISEIIVTFRYMRCDGHGLVCDSP